MIKKLAISLLVIGSLFSVPFFATEVDAQASRPVVLAVATTTPNASAITTKLDAKNLL